MVDPLSVAPGRCARRSPGATKSLVIDMGILLQANQPDELPERLIGTIRLSALDLKTASFLDVKSGKLYPKE